MSMNLRVHAVRCEARDVLWIELRSPDGTSLPPFSAGAHLEVDLGKGLIRHYSLCNDPLERDRYCLGVGLARDSRGGSRLIHESLRVGQTLKVSEPRNNFPLVESASEFLFIAGGIGITPILSMIHECSRRQQRWRLYYCSRNRVRTAFYEELRALPAEAVHFHFDDEQEGRLFDAAAILAQTSTQAHVYTCGPEPLMRAVEAAGASRPQACMHFEWFTATAASSGMQDQGFTVRLAQSGRELQVPPGRSLLDILEEEGVGVPYSCREGLCGTCRTEVLSGTCEHRDKVLSAAERQSHKAIIPCVSRAESAVIELNL